MPEQWDKVRKAMQRKGKSGSDAAALASAITGFVKKKGGGWKYKASLKAKTDKARKAALKKVFK